MYNFHDKIRIYFMSFIVQISPFVHLFTLKIVFRWGASPPEPPTRALSWTCWRPPDPSPQVVPTFHVMPSYAPDCRSCPWVNTLCRQGTLWMTLVDSKFILLTTIQVGKRIKDKKERVFRSASYEHYIRRA